MKFRRKKNIGQEENMLKIIVNCKDIDSKQSLLASLMDDSRVISAQLGDGGTIIHYGSAIGISMCVNNTNGCNNNAIGKIIKDSNEIND